MIRMKKITNLCKILKRIDWYQFFSEIILPWIQLLRSFFFFYSKESILYSRISRRQSATRPLGKGNLLHFPWELHGYVMQASVSPFFPSLPPSHSRFSLFFRQQHRRKFRELRANCSKVKRTTPIMQPTVATSHALSLSLSLSQSVYLRGTVYFTNLLLALRYVGIAKLACPLSCLQNSFPSFTCARVSPLSITRSLRACWLEFQEGIFSVGKFCSDHSRNLVDNPF